MSSVDTCMLVSPKYVTNRKIVSTPSALHSNGFAPNKRSTSGVPRAAAPALNPALYAASKAWLSASQRAACSARSAVSPSARVLRSTRRAKGTSPSTLISSPRAASAVIVTCVKRSVACK